MAESEQYGHAGPSPGAGMLLTVLVMLLAMVGRALGCGGMNFGRSFKTGPQRRVQRREPWVRMSHAGTRGAAGAICASLSVAMSSGCTPSQEGF